MIDWLENYTGKKTFGNNMERVELENLRKEMTKYKKKYFEEDKELHEESDKVFLIIISNVVSQ